MQQRFVDRLRYLGYPDAGRQPTTPRLNPNRSRMAKLVYCLSLFAASLCLNVWLGWRLTARVAAARSDEGIPTGVSLPTLAATDQHGSPITISMVGIKPTMLFVMAPDCPFCAANANSVREFAARNRRAVRCIGLSLSGRGLKQFLDAHPLPFPIYSAGDLANMYALAFRSVPQVVLISPDGVARRVLVGKLDPADSLTRASLLGPPRGGPDNAAR